MRAVSVAIALLAVLGGPGRGSASRTHVSFEFFQSSLEPFGSWHVSASFGRVWIPHMRMVGWHPYSHGHWVYTDLGWTWVSDYEWGSIPYHYGTWALDPEFGWVWVPGYVWAPSWVVFRSGPSYVGWAPVPPSFSIGASFSFDDYGPDHFVFVRGPDFLAPHLHIHAVPIERSRVVFRDTQIINRLRIENDVVVNRGLDVQRVERIARAPVQPEPIERVPRVAPTGRVTRDDLRVDPSWIERGHVRAAAPVEARASHEPGRIQPRRQPNEPRERRPRGRERPHQAPREAPREAPGIAPARGPRPGGPAAQPQRQHGGRGPRHGGGDEPMGGGRPD